MKDEWFTTQRRCMKGIHGNFSGANNKDMKVESGKDNFNMLQKLVIC